MINLYTTKRFEKSLAKFLKQHPELESTLAEKINIFIQNPQNQSLRTHKLSGNLADHWAFSLNYDYRISFIWDGNDIFLTSIGSHDVVY